MKGISRTVRRRRFEGKTDYKARMSLLVSGKARVVVRKTNKYIIGQIVAPNHAHDSIVVGVHSKELLAKGWPEKLHGSLKSLPAAYLTGYYLAKKSKQIHEGILDIGLQRTVPRSRIYAFVKGLQDGGFLIACSADVLPDEKMLMHKDETGKLIKSIKESMK